MNGKILFLVMVPVVVCSLSVNAADDPRVTRTEKMSECFETSGLCVVNCDPGTVVLTGGCDVMPRNIGLSVNYPSAYDQWACQPTAHATHVICQ
jgi:hypothetical protein